MEKPQPVHVESDNGEWPKLRFLRLSHVAILDEILSSVGDYGEVHLVIEKGRLRFVVVQKSFDALKMQSGAAALETRRLSG